MKTYKVGADISIYSGSKRIYSGVVDLQIYAPDERTAYKIVSENAEFILNKPTIQSVEGDVYTIGVNMYASTVFEYGNGIIRISPVVKIKAKSKKEALRIIDDCIINHDITLNPILIES